MDPEMTSDMSDSVTAGSPLSSDDYFAFILYEVAVPLLYGIVTVLGVVGNSLVIYVIVSRERMRTVTNLLLLNLAVADLSFVIVIPPSTAYVFAAKQKHPPKYLSRSVGKNPKIKYLKYAHFSS